MRIRREKAFYVASEYAIIGGDLQRDGTWTHYRAIVQCTQLVYAKGPQDAEQRALETWPDEYLTIKSVLPVRNLRLARRMLEGDNYNPDLDYERGSIEEEMEEWQTEQEPGR